MDGAEKRLVKIAEMVADRAGSELSRHLEKVRRLEAKIATLRILPTEQNGDTAFYQTGGDRRWRDWQVKELVRLNKALAQLKAGEPALRQASGRASVRKELLVKLTSKTR